MFYSLLLNSWNWCCITERVKKNKRTRLRKYLVWWSYGSTLKPALRFRRDPAAKGANARCSWIPQIPVGRKSAATCNGCAKRTSSSHVTPNGNEPYRGADAHLCHPRVFRPANTMRASRWTRWSGVQLWYHFTWQQVRPIETPPQRHTSPRRSQAVSPLRGNESVNESVKDQSVVFAVVHKRSTSLCSICSFPIGQHLKEVDRNFVTLTLVYSTWRHTPAATHCGDTTSCLSHPYKNPK